MKNILIKNGRVIDPANRVDELLDIYVRDGKVAELGVLKYENYDDCELIDAKGMWVVPGLIDLHVHFRDPGQTHKEDLQSGAKAAAMGGFTTVCTMPNTNPVIDNTNAIKYQLDYAKETGIVSILPIGAITCGLKGKELTPIKEMAEKGAVGISEDGLSVKNAYLQMQAMKIAAELGIVTFSHCEDLDLAAGGVMNYGKVSEKLGLPGIVNIAEDVIISRDILIAEATGAKLHICHVTTKGGVQLIREAKARGVKVTAEACPHHFILCDEDIDGSCANFKMNPPLRSRKDVEAVISGIKDGTIDIIATDHAPHHADEKAKGFLHAPNGIAGLETALPLSMTLVDKGILTPLELIGKMSLVPANILGIDKGHLSVGAYADIAVINPEAVYIVNPDNFASKGRNTPFAGREVKGKVVHTIYEGKIVVKEGKLA